MAELRLGILVLPEGKKRERLQVWLDGVAASLQCLPWDSQASFQWASLVVRARRRGTTLPLLDSMIAATALARGLTLVTRNVTDFEACGVKVLNPFAH